MGYFENINFETTNDGSVGLFDKKIGDIFHSRSGALKEANEKFINPILKVLSYFSENINVLDICYGIGYNTKALFNEIKGYNINVDALEYNPNFIFLSPFIKDEINNNELKLFLLSQIYNSIKENGDLALILEEILSSNYDEFISPFTKLFIERFKTEGDIYNPIDNQQALLHNIYYNYISQSMETYVKPTGYNKSSVNFYLGDARKSILTTNKIYDVVFLDAFSPQKDPTLWTIDFLSILKMKMKTNGLLLSYSKSVPFRSALLQLGFYVGKTILDNVDMGTVASLNSFLVQNKLSKNDFDVIETRSGIPYRDINLSLSSSQIIINRSIEGAASSRISRTQFQRLYL